MGIRNADGFFDWMGMFMTFMIQWEGDWKQLLAWERY